jgi:hypothetical protein
MSCRGLSNTFETASFLLKRGSDLSCSKAVPFFTISSRRKEHKSILITKGLFKMFPYKNYFQINQKITLIYYVLQRTVFYYLKTP